MRYRTGLTFPESLVLFVLCHTAQVRIGTTVTISLSKIPIMNTKRCAVEIEIFDHTYKYNA